jgi:hypothetical protein
MLQQIADSEAKDFLRHAFEKFQNLSGDMIVSSLLGPKTDSIRHLSILFFAWNHNGTPEALECWLRPWLGKLTPEQITAMVKAYGNPALLLSDYAYLLGVHPLDLWCAGQLRDNPALSWDDLWKTGEQARRMASSWLFKTRNRAAQDLRLRIRIEEDAFLRMTPYWQRLGFPFDRLIPSYATAIGSSGDRPAALAKLMGIIVNHGMQMPTYRISRLEFAPGTPYETVMEPQIKAQRVLPAVVADTIRDVLVGTVEIGTAQRAKGAFKLPDGTQIVVGGKTGSGDNRFESFGRHGQLLSARPVNRTAIFVFYVGGRYFGALTAFVPGSIAGDYQFTSSLPVAITKILAPDLDDRLASDRSSLLVYDTRPQAPEKPKATPAAPAVNGNVTTASIVPPVSKVDRAVTPGSPTVTAPIGPEAPKPAPDTLAGRAQPNGEMKAVLDSVAVLPIVAASPSPGKPQPSKPKLQP